MLYRLNELHRTLVGPTVHLAHAGALMFSGPGNWLAHLPGAAQVAAGYELIYRLGREYPKPEFGIHAATVAGTEVIVREETALSRPFCRLLHFRRYSDDANVVAAMKQHPVVLVVAPLSGHHATLLRERCTRCSGPRRLRHRLGRRAHGALDRAHSPSTTTSATCASSSVTSGRALHVIAVCQPTVPVLAAVALMAARRRAEPRSSP